MGFGSWIDHRCPHLAYGVTTDLDWVKFHEAIINAWGAIEQGKIDTIIGSMPRHIEAVRRGKAGTQNIRGLALSLLIKRFYYILLVVKKSQFES